MEATVVNINSVKNLDWGCLCISTDTVSMQDRLHFLLELLSLKAHFTNPGSYLWFSG